MPADPRERLLLSDLADVDVRKRLVVAQQDVERRAVPLDHVALEEQRLDVACRGHHLEAAGQRHHPLQPGAERRGLGVRGQALLQRLRLADVEHLALVVEHPVDPGPVRQNQNVALDQRNTTPGRPRARLTADARRAARRPVRTRPLFRSFHETLLSCFLSGEEAKARQRPRHQTGHALETGPWTCSGQERICRPCAMACSPFRHTCPPVGQQWVKPEHDQGAQIPAQGFLDQS